GLGRELELKKPMMEAALEERIRQIQRAEDEQLSQLDEVIARKQRADESTVLEEAQRLAILGSTNAKINAEELKHVLQIRRLANDYSEAVGQKLTEVARLQAERTALSTYARPIAAGDCAGIKPLNPPREASPCLGVKAIEVTVKRGIMHVVEQRFEGMFDEQLTRTVITNLNLQQSLHKIIPDGTEYSVEHRGTSAIVRVHDGKVRVSAEGQDEVTVAAGQQISLPDSTVSPLTETSFGRVIGLPVAELPLNSQMAEAYGEQSLVADGETLPQGWLWQDTDPYMSGPGEAKLEFVAADTLRVTVPTENEFYRQRFDAPRLLRKVSGDFDLEADMNLESRGGNHAFSQFVIFSPDTPIGYLAGDMNPGGLDAHYLVLGGGRGLWMNVNKLQVFGRQWTDCDDAPQGAVRVKLTRRGDHWKTYFSTDEGQTWTLSSRHVLTMPETIWAGWVFRRMAHDGLADEPAVTTLKDVQLNSAPLHSLGEPNWDVVRFAGSTVVPSTKQVLLAQDGTDAHPARAYSTREISGDFDLVARYESLSMVLQQGQRRWIQLAVSSRDEKNIAFVRHDLTAEAERLESDIYINEGGGRYRHVDIQNAGTGRMRIRRQGGVLSTFVWQRDDWMRLGDWSQGFDDPVYIDLRFQWISPVAAPQAASFYLERLETEAGLLIGNHVDNEIAKAPPASTDVAPKPLAEKDASAGMSYRHPAGLLTIPLPAEWAIHYGLRGRQRDADFDTLADQRQERLIIFWRGSEPAPDPIAALDKFRSDVQAATSTIRDIQSKGYSLRGVPIVEVVYVQPESGNLICRFAAIAGGQRVHFDMVSRTVPERLMLPQDLQAILTTIEFAQVSAVVPQEPTKPEEPADIVLAERPPQTQARTMIRRQLDGRPRVVGINAVSAGTPAAAALGIESPLGAVIARVYPDTPAALAGLRAGDLIVQFGERTIENLEDLEATILSAPVNSRHNVTYVRGMRRLETEIYVARGDDSRPILGRFNHVTGDFHLDVLPAWIIQPDLNRDSVTRRLFHRIESGDKNYVIHIFRDSPPARDVDASLNEFVSKMRPEFASSHSGALQIGNHPGVFVSGPAELDGRRCTLYRIAFVINQRRHQIDIFAPPLSEPAELPFVAQVILGSLAD
ncbi:MAG TPA: PDZ domain-containing protein, partial [Pirellulaceae bacterium]|nr:PDZ domain-containing protein [Pirellulaceae bacterium]